MIRRAAPVERSSNAGLAAVERPKDDPKGGGGARSLAELVKMAETLGINDESEDNSYTQV